MSRRSVAITAALSALTSAACVSSAFDIKSDTSQDVQLRAMLDELARSKTLSLNNLDKPYFISYSASDSDQLSVTASLGGVIAANRIHVRQPRVEVRVGSYNFDNTNSVFSSNPPTGFFPVDDDYNALRTELWFTTDGLYNAAAEEIMRKRGSLREVADADKTQDFANAKPFQLLLPPVHTPLDQEHWETGIKSLSAQFTKHPSVTSSAVRLLAISSTYRFVNTEGTVIRIPQELAEIEIRATSLAPDGSRVWNHEYFTALQVSDLPSMAELSKKTEEVAAQTDALRTAPASDDYTGPVLFEQQAAAQLMAALMADAAHLQRRPIAPDGSNKSEALDSVWASRTASKVMPEWISVFDDPTQKEFQGTKLVGNYPADDEGVPATRVSLIENGILKGFLSSRQPVHGLNTSNAHGRLPGGYGSEAAVVGNLFVQAGQTVSEAQMKSKLLERVKTAGLKYGLLIRRLDFPSTANLQELQNMARQLQRDGYSRTIVAPLLVYRVYPDGREELVRNLRFKEFSAKDLRDLSAASDRPYVLNYVNNGSGFDFADVMSDATTSSVICPSLLFDSIELSRTQDQLTKPPAVTPPALIAQN